MPRKKPCKVGCATCTWWWRCYILLARTGVEPVNTDFQSAMLPATLPSHILRMVQDSNSRVRS